MDCPKCSVRVRADARECKHCGATLSTAPAVGTPVVEPEDVRDVGPVAIAVGVGLLLGFAVGSPYEGWNQSVFPILGAAAGAGIWWIFDGPLAAVRLPKADSPAEAEPTADAEAEPTADAEAEPTADAEAEPTADAEAEPTPEAEAEPTPE